VTVESVRFVIIYSNGHSRIVWDCGWYVIAALDLTEERRHKELSFIENAPKGAVVYALDVC
jgi:hypothetical protein